MPGLGTEGSLAEACAHPQGEPTAGVPPAPQDSGCQPREHLQLPLAFSTTAGRVKICKKQIYFREKWGRWKPGKRTVQAVSHWEMR